MRGGLTLKKLTKLQRIYSVLCFNLGRTGASFGGAKPPKALRGNGTATAITMSLLVTLPAKMSAFNSLIQQNACQRNIKWIFAD